MQAARFAPAIWGVQWHPEAGEEIIRPWADHDRDDAVERGVDVDRYLGDVIDARDDLRATWRVLADSFAEVCRGPVAVEAASAVTDGRVATASGRLARLGFVDAERSAACLERLGPHADALVHMLAATADPDQAIDYLAELADRVDQTEGDRAACSTRSSTTRARRCGCSPCSARAPRSATTCCVIPSSGTTSATRASAPPGRRLPRCDRT